MTRQILTGSTGLEAPYASAPDLDLLSGTSLRKLSYILKLLFPVAVFEETPAWSESILFKMKDTSIATGSRTENFHLPMILEIDKDFKVIGFDQSDLDVMHRWGGSMCVLGEDGISVEDNDQNTSIVMESYRCHPGYTHLRVYNKSADCKNLTGWTKKGEDGVKEFFSASKMVEAEYERYNLSHGPAAVSVIVVAEQDHVFFLKCQNWPRMASDWLSRCRPSGWPSNDIINDIKAEGCLLVPVSHPHSKIPQLEWRLSFSVAEKILAKTLNETQRVCYLLLKILFTVELKQPKGLCSYHMKNILFWTCEQVPASHWNPDSMAGCLLYLLDRLVRCLASRNMPHYFIPKNNLIDHMNPDALDILAKRTVAMRKDPLKFLLEFKERGKFFTGPFSESPSHILKPIMDTHEVNDAACIKAGLDMAALFIMDAPLCHFLAGDMLQCYGKLFKGKFALRHHVQTVLQPVFCASNVLDSTERSRYSTGFARGSSLSMVTDILEQVKIFFSVNNALSDAQSQLDRTLRGGTDPGLKELAAVLAKILEAYAARVQCTTEAVDANHESEILYGKRILCIVFSYMIVLLNGEIDAAWSLHLQDLEEIQSIFHGKQKYNRYFRCCNAVLAATYLRIRAMPQLLAMIEKFPSDSLLVTVVKRLITEQIEKCAKTPSISDQRYVDAYFHSPTKPAYGCVFDLHCDDRKSLYYKWEVLYFVKFKTLPEGNAFKSAFGKLAESFFTKGIEAAGGDRLKHIPLRADYANFLVDCGRFSDALHILKSVIGDIKASEYDVYNEYIGYLKLVVSKDLFRGLSKSMHTKASFHSLIYAYFFAVKSLVQLQDLETAASVAHRMESDCDSVYKRTKTKVPWQVSANNYCLLGHAYRLCNQNARAILAFGMVTHISHHDVPELDAQACIDSMQSLNCPLAASPKEVAISYIQMIHPISRIVDIWPRLLKTLYPHLKLERSTVHFFHLVYGRHPKAADMGLFLQVIANSLSPSAMAQFALALEVFVQTIYPDASTLAAALESALKVLYPERDPHSALQTYLHSVIADATKLGFATDNVIQKFFSKVPNEMDEEGIIILARYVRYFLGHLSLKKALQQYFQDRHPNDPLEESVKKYFEEENETGDLLLDKLVAVIENTCID